MSKILVVITEDSSYSDYGYYRKGDVGFLVGFTQGCGVVMLDRDNKFVKVEVRNLEGFGG